MNRKGRPTEPVRTNPAEVDDQLGEVLDEINSIREELSELQDELETRKEAEAERLAEEERRALLKRILEGVAIGIIVGVLTWLGSLAVAPPAQQGVSARAVQQPQPQKVANRATR